MPEQQRISEMTTAATLDGTDLLEIAQVNAGSSSGYASAKTTMTAIGNKLNTEIQYGGLSTTAKTIVGAINEAASSGGGTTVVANPQGEATDTLSTIQIDQTIYDFAGGSGGSWVDVKGTLTAGQTSITLTNLNIMESSTFDFYTDKFGVNPTNAVVTNGSITLTFEAQSVDLAVKVRVTNAIPEIVNLVPRLTADDSSEVGVASAVGSVNNKFKPWHAFATEDNYNGSQNGGYWAGNESGTYLQFDFTNKSVITSISFGVYRGGTFTVWYSADGQTYVEGETLTKEQQGSGYIAERTTDVLSTPITCKSIRLVCGTGRCIGATHFYGYEL